MALFTTDYKDLKENSFEPLPTGNYEMVIDSPSEEATKGGTEYFQIPMTVRNDLDGVEKLKATNGKYHNRKTFDLKLWKRKDSGKYNDQDFMYVLKAVGVPDGTPINTMEELAKMIFHKPVKAYIKKTTNTYKGETTDVNNIAGWNLDKTEFPQLQHTFKDDDSKNANPFAESGDQVDISDDDLPF